MLFENSDDVVILENATVGFFDDSLAFSVDLTITGTNFGGETRRVWGPQCRKSQSRSCRLMFQNAVTIFNVSCKNVNLMLSPSTGAAMEKENERKQLAYCKTEETFMLKCSSPFAEKNQRCLILLKVVAGSQG